MANVSKLRVAFIGSGKVATELALIFRFKGIEITGISSRNHLSGNNLSSRLSCPFVTDPSELKADLIIIATMDASVKALSTTLKTDSFVVYTAGAVNLADITEENWGVFYPLQTFTENRHLTVDEVPILIEANSVELRSQLEALCEKIGFQYDYCDS
jgi:predicted homoserine dehydrogenase-like protein